MTREKTPKCVLSFSSITDALAVEAAAAEYGLPGRIIPVPGEIDAGCGFAWAAPADARDALMSACEGHALAYEGVYEVWMY